MEVKKIAEKLNISLIQAEQIKGIIKGTIDPLSFKSVQDWGNQCYSLPSMIELKLAAINEVLEGFGVEYIESTSDSYVDSYGLSYINLGDTYTNTVIFDHSCNKFRFCSWGDIVESSMEEYV